jgi:transposase
MVFELGSTLWIMTIAAINGALREVSVTDPALFRSGREFAAFLGLVPRQNSSGGKDKLGRISKKGDGYLRKLLVVGETSVIRRSKTDGLAAAPWIRSLLERRLARVVNVGASDRNYAPECATAHSRAG